jgi:hypothetical protein
LAHSRNLYFLVVERRLFVESRHLEGMLRGERGEVAMGTEDFSDDDGGAADEEEGGEGERTCRRRRC